MPDDTGRSHGGPDAQGVPRHDFSSNGHALGPCPPAWRAVQRADASRYPDPAYIQLRERLAQHHGVAVERIAIAASGSEFIQRITAQAARAGARHVHVPAHAYGDYALAARAWGLAVVHPDAPAHADGFDDDAQSLAWFCEPGSPAGASPQAAAQLARAGLARPRLTQVIDRAYEPLRLSGRSAFGADVLERLWQLWTPNKALGLTGVRGAYAIAPVVAAAEAVRALEAMAPSWPLGAHGVALLQAWCEPAVADWLAAHRPTLQAWRLRLHDGLLALGWQPLPGDAAFVCAQVPCDPQALPALLQALRMHHGVKLRDCTSFGLPGHVRMAVLPPAAQDALLAGWRDVAGAYSSPK
ncbi:MAG: aminotransferase class I/II-fold pyridoxal phosphate-dependent enzyme [Burkholderiales bacterium]|nr:aminotransferase class I/II-fold pyridoxal phosphate-dependent enzyme [Burkholderiales bacterium]